MRAVQVKEFGGPEVLVATEQPEPVAGPDQMVIDVAAAEILFLDIQLRGGWGRDYFTVMPPYVPGAGVAGTVRSVGGNVAPGWTGRRVIAGTGPSGSYVGGGYAQQATVPAGEVFEVPDGVALSEALAALHDGLMALSQIEKAAIGPGERVLVTAAGGSLGAWLVPLARAAGARVVAAARGEHKLEHTRRLGAEDVVDYSEEGWTARARQATGGAGVDVVFDGAGGRIGRAAFEITAPGGRFFSYGAASGGFADIDADEARRRGVTVVGIRDAIAPEAQGRLLEQALSELAAGHIGSLVGRTFPLEHAAKAHAAIENRQTIGKTLLLA
ncbi:zinc-binding dehydrogenase [Allosalinactinospora lopnorensis]|uniref:zinc-binding dehydrogenase n=1 Tax=Allosalinactinospora lopnorensis TaxID=1352348 RepID=UPI000623F00E|nr:zinc-binding dehydrogenase [Allosalinactinospora lopnorensis]